jgi:hypothetical protein
MSNSKYNNTLACKKYYDRNRDDPEFRKRKAMNTKRSNYKTGYYKRKNLRLWKIFQIWKNLIVKPMANPVKKPVYTKVLEAFRLKRKTNLIKLMVDAWKLYERTPKSNISIKPIFCVF